jgi:hypothetical protein
MNDVVVVYVRVVAVVGYCAHEKALIFVCAHDRVDEFRDLFLDLHPSLLLLECAYFQCD